MEILINKKTALNRVMFGKTISNGLFVILIGVMIIAMNYINILPVKFVKESDWFLPLLYIILMLGNFIYFNLYFKKLMYEYESDKLTITYKIITKNRIQARLQVVNDVNISQNLMDRLFNLFTVEIFYGFSNGGYSFYFKYLTEEQAHTISDNIKVTGKNININ